MKILHLVQNYFPSVGGTQAVIQELSEGFVRRYHDQVTVFTTNALNNPHMRDNEFLPLGDECINEVLVRRFGFWRKHRSLIRGASRNAHRLHLPLRDYLDVLSGDPMSPSMMIAVQRASVDVIGCMAFPYMQMYYPFMRPLGPNRPVVLFGALHLHGDHVARPILEATRRAQAYIAFTDYERQVLVRNRIPVDRVHVVGLGVDHDRFARANGAVIRQRYGLGDAPVVGFIGRQAAYKGCDTLVQAMTKVWARFPNAHLVIAGSRTKFSPQLDALVGALPAAQQERVTITHDFSEQEKPEWFAACDVVACISRQESFGIVFVEAWACGKPVIGGRIGAVECVIRDGEDGMLVPCGEPAHLAKAIEVLLADDQLRERLGRRGLDKVLRDHTWSIVVDRIHAIYERVASEWH